MPTREPAPPDPGRDRRPAAEALPGAGDPELASHAAAFRSELRAEAAEWEQLAAKQRLRRRTLAEAVREWLHRGDLVAVAVGGYRTLGTIAHVGADLACLAVDAGTVDVDLNGPATWQRVERARSGGLARSSGPPTFAARLAEHEIAGAPVTLVGAVGDLVVGVRIEAVGVDHVVASGGERQWLLPLPAVAAVWPAGG